MLHERIAITCPNHFTRAPASLSTLVTLLLRLTASTRPTAAIHRLCRPNTSSSSHFNARHKLPPPIPPCFTSHSFEDQNTRRQAVPHTMGSNGLHPPALNSQPITTHNKHTGTGSPQQHHSQLNILRSPSPVPPAQGRSRIGS